jgi:hypothetical protein
MTRLFRTQIDLFTKPVVPTRLIGVERQKAVALLQALLTEVVTKPTGQSSDAVKKEVGGE